MTGLSIALPARSDCRMVGSVIVVRDPCPECGYPMYEKGDGVNGWGACPWCGYEDDHDFEEWKMNE